PASGGVATDVVLEPRQVSHRFPQFLPDGRRFLFYVLGASDAQGIYLGSLDSTKTTRLIESDAGGVFVSPGWLFFTRQGALLGRRLDLAREQLTGDPLSVADGLYVDGSSYAAALSASGTGFVAYRSGGTSRRQLTWFDRSGKALGVLGQPDDNGL